MERRREDKRLESLKSVYTFLTTILLFSVYQMIFTHFNINTRRVVVTIYGRGSLLVAEVFPGAGRRPGIGTRLEDVINWGLVS